MIREVKQGQETQPTQIAEAANEKFWKRIKFGAIILIIAALIIAPRFTGNYMIYVLSLWAITTIAAQGLNLTMGFAGKVSLAQGAFMGIGAYVSVLLVKNGWANYWGAMLIAVIICMLVGALIGFPALRVKGHYLAFVTLAFNELVILVLQNEEQWTGGPLGILDIARPSIFGYSLFEPVRFYYFCLAMLGIVTLGVWYMIHSPWGRAFKALRDNPSRAESVGLSTMTYTLLAFAIGSGLAGIAGTMMAPLVEFIDPLSFDLNKSLEFLLMVMVGGRGTLGGPFIGAFIAKVLPELLRFANEYYLIVFAVFVIVVILFFPTGITGIGSYLKDRLFSGKKTVSD
jgi:branched-chain amino acid transport system permease protein